MRWRARWRDETGRRRSKSFATRDEAEVELAAIVGDMARGRYVDPEISSITFAEYSERWFAAREYSPLTRVGTRYRMNLYIMPFFGRRRLRDITPSVVQAWNVEMRDRGLSPSTRALAFGFVLSVLAQAVDDGLLARNPAASRTVRPPRRVRTKVEPWPLERVQAFREQLPPRWRILVDLGALAGMRQGETFGFSVDDIDWSAGVVHVRRQVLGFPSSKSAFALPKYSKQRAIPAPERLLDALDDHLRLFPAREVTLPWGDLDGDLVSHPLVASSREGGPAAKNYMSQMVWRPALQRAGIEMIRANGSHALRHHYASMLLAAGESILVVAERLGHSDPAFTLRTYTHVMPGSEQRTRDILDSAWAAPVIDEAAAVVDEGPRTSQAPAARRPTRRGHLRAVD